MILLPVSFLATAPISQLEAILAHELAHVRRFDYVVNLLQTMVETLFFYHPAVWWLSHRIRVERENCCDDLVVATLGNRVEYGRALLAVQELRGQGALLSLGARDGSLLARVRRLLSDPAAPGQRSNAGPVGLGFLCVGLLAAGIWITASAQVVEGDENDAQPKAEQKFIAEVGSGISVELVAVLPDGEKSSGAWRPDGLAFDEPPRIDEERKSPGRGDETHNLVVKFSGLKPSQSVTYRLSGLRTSWNRDDSGLARLTANLTDAKRPMTLRVGISDVHWGPFQSVDVRGKKMKPVDIPAACREVYDQIKPDHIEERVNAFLFCWSSLSSQDDRAQTLVFAVDKDGKRHAPDGSTNWSTDDGDFSAEVFDIPINRIDHLEYQLRPYRHWVTFENVAVDPGDQTEVKVTVTTVASGYAAQTLTDRVITRIKQRRLPFVSAKHLAVLRQELFDYLDARVPNQVTPGLLQSILQAVDTYVPARFTGPDSYLKFRSEFDMLKWRVWTATERIELTPQQRVHRETQRKWMRDQVRNLPPSNTGTRVPAWTHQGRLDVLEIGSLQQCAEPVHS